MNWMCEISALECKQTETKEHEVEIGLVSKTGGGSTSAVQGHHKPQHVSAQQCQQGHKFSTHWESISHREGRTWKRGVSQRHWNTASCVTGFGAQFSECFFFSSICKLGDPVKWSFPEPAQEPVASWGKEIVLGVYLRIKFITSAWKL